MLGPRSTSVSTCFISFDNFCTLNKKIKSVYINRDTWQLSTCTCYDFHKFFICKHIIFLAIKLKCTEIDYSFKNIGSKAKRGRKSKATHALLKM